MKIKKEDIPVTMQSEDSIMRAIPGYGGMTVGYSEMPAGTDMTPSCFRHSFRGDLLSHR